MVSVLDSSKCTELAADSAMEFSDEIGRIICFCVRKFKKKTKSEAHLVEDQEALLVLHLTHVCVRMRAELTQPYAVHLESTFFSSSR